MPPHVLVNSIADDVHQSGGQVKVLPKRQTDRIEKDERVQRTRVDASAWPLTFSRLAASHARRVRRTLCFLRPHSARRK